MELFSIRLISASRSKSRWEQGTIVKGFENALIGMGLNERKSFVLEPEEAYGERDERLERRFDRSSLQLGFEPVRGQVILFQTRKGRNCPQW